MSEDRQRLLLLINSLEGGGAENVMAQLSATLVKSLKGVEIRLALLDDQPRAYTVNPDIRVEQLDCRGSFWRSVLQTRRLIAGYRPDVVLSFLTRANCAAILSRRVALFRCVISERINTSSHLGSGLSGSLRRRLVLGLYPGADVVIAVSEGVRQDVVRCFNVPANRVRVIHNPVDIDRLRIEGAKPPQLALPDDFFVNVGRLVPNKGGRTLLHAFAQHRNKTRALVVLGEGPEREALEQLARELGIFDRVHLPGYVGNPHAIVRLASAYVSASRSEGFPNALVEAMALGRAVVMTDCPSGPAEILADRDTGLTRGFEPAPWGILTSVEDINALASAMDFLDDPANRRVFEDRARQRAQAFSSTAAVAAYVQALGFDEAGHRRSAPLNATA